jgi:hypothetical protein
MKGQNYVKKIMNVLDIWCIQKFPDWVDDNEIYAYNKEHSLRSNTNYGGKTH